jgi:Zn-dependent peptidase ImmA (M78 family)
LFILAHELAHIALGHSDDDGALIDENVKHNVQDEEETAAKRVRS